MKKKDCGCNGNTPVLENVDIIEDKEIIKSKKYYGIISIIKDYIKGNVVYIDKVGMQNRLDICNDCNSLTKINTCKECGCFVKIKVKYHESKCPLNKW